MDFMKPNLIATTGVISVDSNTILAENIFNPDLNYQYFSEGFANDATTTTVTIDFGSTLAVSRIALMTHNLKAFTFYYDGATASTFSLNNADTTTSDYSSNSQTSQFWRFDTVTTQTISFDLKSTIEANQEKYFSFLFITDTHFQFDRFPSSNQYKSKINPKQVVHTMSDGGTRIQNIARKYDLDIQLKFLTPTQREQLYDIYDLQDVFSFAPFATTTGWDRVLFECNWVGDFDFNEYADNSVDAGYKGRLRLKET